MQNMHNASWKMVQGGGCGSLELDKQPFLIPRSSAVLLLPHLAWSLIDKSGLSNPPLKHRLKEEPGAVGVEDLPIKQTALVQLCLHLKEICFWMRGDSVIVFLLRTHLRQRKVTRIFRNYSRHSIELAPTPLSEPWQPLSWLFAQNCDDTISRWEKNVWLVTNTMAPTLNMFSSFDTLWKRKRQQACLS